MNKNIAVLPGDGVGPEVVDCAVQVLKKIAQIYQHDFHLEYGLIGACAIDKTGNPLPEATLKLCKKSDAILFGAIGSPVYDNNPNAKMRPEQGLLKLRKSLDLFANLRPVSIYPELSDISPLKKEKISQVDLLFIRELTGGIYFGKPRKRLHRGTTAVDTSIYSKWEIIRISKIAFEMASKRRKHLTLVDKANVLETSRLWRETVNQMAIQYPPVKLDQMFVDNAAMQLIKNPKQFDVILTENMFGDILTDEASVIAGSIGLLPSASVGEKFALYEPIHGSFHKASGKNVANPIGAILSGAMMLRISFGLEEEAQMVEKAIKIIIQKGYRTKDLTSQSPGNDKLLGTKEFGAKIIQYLPR